MAITTCVDCGGQVSTSATTCPHCGRPTTTPTISPTQSSSLGILEFLDKYFLGVLRKYAVFHGRTGLREFWYFQGINAVVLVFITVIDLLAGTFDSESGIGIFATFYILAVLIPLLAVQARRYHDTDHSAWWLLIGFVPCAGMIVQIVFSVQAGMPGENQYGSNPESPAP